MSSQTREPCSDRAAQRPQSTAIVCSVPSEEMVLCSGTDKAFTMVVVMGWGLGGSVL